MPLEFPAAYAAAMYWLGEAAFFAQAPMRAPREATFFAAVALSVLRGEEHAEKLLGAALGVFRSLGRMPAEFINPGAVVDCSHPGMKILEETPEGALPRPMPPENGALLGELAFSGMERCLSPDMMREIIEFALVRSSEEALHLTQRVVNHPDYVAVRLRTERGKSWGSATEEMWRAALAGHDKNGTTAEKE